MNFLNRKMFQAGGSADNQLFYIDASGKKNFLDAEKLLPVLRTTDITALEALIQNPDVTYSPATQEIFRQVVGERKAGFSSVDPSLFQFGDYLPDYLSGLSGLRDVAGFGGDFAGQVVEGLVNVGRGVLSGFGERSVGQEKVKAKDYLPSERFPNVEDTISGRPSGREGFISGINESGVLRRGYTNPQLASILNRALGDVQDFSTEIEEIKAPEPELASVDPIPVDETLTDEDILPEPTLFPTTESETIGQMYPPGSIGALEAEQRRLAYLEAIKDVDEFGDPLPESRLEQDDEITKAIKEILPAEVKIDVDKTEADTLLDTQAKFDGTFDIEKPDLLKVDTTVTEEDEETRNTARIPVVPKETTGLFGSDRFLDFIRNVGGQLVATGQMGEGLATGAAKAAEERTARELLKEQEEKKYQRDLEMAIAVQRVKNQGTNTGLKPSELGALQTDVTEISTTVKDYEGTEASIDIMNSAIDLFDKAIEDGVPITGLPGYAVRGMDKLKAFFGATDTNVSDSTKIQNYIDQVKQRSIREILNESGRTISNLDREIVDKVFGELDLTGDPKEIRKKLANARANLIRNNEDKKRIIEGKYTIIQNPAYQGVGIQAVSPYLESILRIISGQPAEGVTGTGSGVIGSSSVIDIDL
jgi:hypothetical protein